MSRNGKNLWSEVARQVLATGLKPWSYGFPSRSRVISFLLLARFCCHCGRCSREGRDVGFKRSFPIFRLSRGTPMTLLAGIPRIPFQGSEDQKASHGNIMESSQRASLSGSGYPVCHDPFSSTNPTTRNIPRHPPPVCHARHESRSAAFACSHGSSPRSLQGIRHLALRFTALGILPPIYQKWTA